MTAKTITIAQYEGLIARVCGAFGLMPAADTPMSEISQARFDAVVRLCDMKSNSVDKHPSNELN